VTIRDAAARYGAAGLFVFPTSGKTPLTPNGFHDAVTGRDAALELFGRFPGATGVGLDCGRSAVLVVDVDGEEAWQRLARVSCRIGGFPATREATTGRDGGTHIYFRTCDPRARNSAGLLAPGVDTRGAGGFVVLPPSRHPSGRLYQWSNWYPACEPPEWLLEKLAPPPPPQAGERRPLPIGERVTSYGRAALEGLADQMLAAPEGTRHDTLLHVARRAGRLEAAGELDAALAEDVLTEAALRAGLAFVETERTFRDGFAYGQQFPATRAVR
jgi:hypothetical protein